MTPDENGVNVPGVGALDYGPDGIVQREVVDLLGPDGNDVGLFTWGERTDAAAVSRTRNPAVKDLWSAARDYPR